jgi:hypothetical protein
MIDAFRRGCQDLGEIWAGALKADTLTAVRRLGGCLSEGDAVFHLDDRLWARVVLDFASAYRHNPLSRGIILRSLTPLYLARVASFVRETESLVASEVEERIEQLCLTFEELKPYLIAGWDEYGVPAQGPRPPLRKLEQSQLYRENQEV